MIKRYFANSSEYDISLILKGGRTIVLKFEGKDIVNKTRFADITDKDIQEALEAAPSFGLYFHVSNEFNWTENATSEEMADITTIPGVILLEEEAKPELKVKEVKEIEDIKEINVDEFPAEEKTKVFSTGADAKFWLNQTMKVPSARLTNKTKMTEEAELLGYTIEFETK